MMSHLSTYRVDQMDDVSARPNERGCRPFCNALLYALNDTFCSVSVAASGCFAATSVDSIIDTVTVALSFGCLRGDILKNNFVRHDHLTLYTKDESRRHKIRKKIKYQSYRR